MIGDESLATSFEFKGSIAEDTYNRVKLIRENQEAQKREVYLVMASRKIGLWGSLQYFERVNENFNYAQIKERADMILKAKNRPIRHLKVTALGDVCIVAGTGVILGLSKLRNEGFKVQEYALISGCKHTWGGQTHVMDLTLKVV